MRSRGFELVHRPGADSVSAALIACRGLSPHLGDFISTSLFRKSQDNPGCSWLQAQGSRSNGYLYQ